MADVGSLSESYERLLREREQYLSRARRDARESFARAAAGGNISTSRVGSSGTLQGSFFARRAINAIDSGGTVSVVNMVLLGVAQLKGEMMEDLANFGYELAKVNGRRTGMAEAHKRIAAKAQAAVVESYNKRVGYDTPSRTKNRLKGKMKEALTNANFITTNRNEIAFGNISMMYSLAPHWRRLNFGAGAMGQKRKPQSFPFNFSGTRASGKDRLQLTHNPGAAFRMPPGVFYDGSQPIPYDSSRARHAGGPGGDFYPVNYLSKGERKAARPFIGNNTRGKYYTRGIQGYHFLDAGLRKIANELPREYNVLANKWAEEARRPRNKSVRTRAR